MKEDFERVLSEIMPGSERRPEQLRIMSEVDSAVRAGANLALEAGTGTGKSLGYLIPAAQWLAERKRTSGNSGERKHRAIIATFTKTLQNQLIKKEIPRIQKKYSLNCCVKYGMENYICLYRMFGTYKAKTIRDEKQAGDLAKLINWAKKSASGALPDAPFTPAPDLWKQINRRMGVCLDDKCQFNAKCFYEKSNVAAAEADIIVVNQALLMRMVARNIKLTRGNGGGKDVPEPYYADSLLVIDEAHEFPGVAMSALGKSASTVQIENALKFLLRSDGPLSKARRRGERIEEKITDIIRLNIPAIIKESKSRFRLSADVQRARVTEDLFVGAVARVTEALIEISDDIDIVKPSTPEEKELASTSRILKDYASAIESTMRGAAPGSDHVCWIEAVDVKGKEFVEFNDISFDISDSLRKSLYQKLVSCVFSSATLKSLGSGPKAFRFFLKSVGLKHIEVPVGSADSVSASSARPADNAPPPNTDAAREEQATFCRSAEIGSPFDYASQMKILVYPDFPDPVKQSAEYEKAQNEVIETFCNANAGGTLALFTNRKHMQSAYEKTPLAGRQKMCQGVDSDIVAKMIQLEGSVAMGVKSLWQGIDIPGKALTCVILSRLPFPVPWEPFAQGISEYIDKQGGKHFFDYHLPAAIIMFRQGAGRLIRSSKDAGVLVVLDPRLKKSNYGHLFLRYFKSCELVNCDGAIRFLQEIATRANFQTDIKPQSAALPPAPPPDALGDAP